MLPTDQWESIKQRFPRSLESEVTETEFYTEDKFALWIDLRSHADNEIHGSGLALKDTRDGVKLEIRRKVGGSGNITCDMFIVADALMEIKIQTLILYCIDTGIEDSCGLCSESKIHLILKNGRASG